MISRVRVRYSLRDACSRVNTEMIVYLQNTSWVSLNELVEKWRAVSSGLSRLYFKPNPTSCVIAVSTTPQHLSRPLIVPLAVVLECYEPGSSAWLTSTIHLLTTQTKPKIDPAVACACCHVLLELLIPG